MKRGSPYKRAIRRHHRQRLLNKWIRRIYIEIKQTKIGRETESIEQRARYLVQTPCPCSCAMCGNPRKHFGERTIQERRLGIE